MKKILENILNIKIEINYSCNGIKLKNKDLEDKYLASKKKTRLLMKFIMFLIFFFVYFGILYFVKSKSNQENRGITYRFELTLGFAVLDTLSNILIFFNIKFFETNRKKDIVIVFRILLIFCCFYFYSLQRILEEPNYPYFFRNIYLIIFVKNLFYLIASPNSIYLNFIFCIFNTSFIYISHYFQLHSLVSVPLIIDLFVEIFASCSVFLLKRKLEISERIIFAQNLLMDNFYVYYDDILSSFNCLHFSFKSRKILYFNKLAENKIFKNFKINNKDNSNINQVQKNNFFVSLSAKENDSILDINKHKTLENIGLSNCNKSKNKNTVMPKFDQLNKNFASNNKTKHSNNDWKHKGEEHNEQHINILLEKMSKYNKLTLNPNLNITNIFDQSNNNFNHHINNNIFDDSKIHNLKDFYFYLENNNYNSLNKSNTIKIEPKNKSKDPFCTDNIFGPESFMNNENSPLDNGILDKSDTLVKKNPINVEEHCDEKQDINNKININNNSEKTNKNNNSHNFSKPDDNSYSFIYLGEFSYEVNYQESNSNTYCDKKNKYYDIYFRKIFEIIEFIIYDKTKSKILEISSIEFQVRQNLFGKIAHEFKTPLNSIISLINNIKTYANFVNGTNYSQNIISNAMVRENLKQDLNTITGLSNYTMFLISDIISYSNNMNINKQQEIKVDLEFVSLKKILKFNFEILKALISCNETKAQNIKPGIYIENNLDQYKIKTDEFRLNQILLNLISNAVKFTRTGEIIISLELTKTIIEEKEKRFILISIQDSGMGIKKEQQKLIFSESADLNLNYSVNKFGSGLGLSICAAMAHKLNYKIDFTSRENKGTKFFIEIPISLENAISKDSQDPSRRTFIIKNNRSLKTSLEFEEENICKKLFKHSGSISFPKLYNTDSLNSMKKNFLRHQYSESYDYESSINKRNINNENHKEIITQGKKIKLSSRSLILQEKGINSRQNVFLKISKNQACKADNISNMKLTTGKFFNIKVQQDENGSKISNNKNTTKTDLENSINEGKIQSNLNSSILKNENFRMSTFEQFSYDSLYPESSHFRTINANNQNINLFEIRENSKKERSCDDFNQTFFLDAERVNLGFHYDLLNKNSTYLEVNNKNQSRFPASKLSNKSCMKIPNIITERNNFLCGESFLNRNIYCCSKEEKEFYTDRNINLIASNNYTSNRVNNISYFINNNNYKKPIPTKTNLVHHSKFCKNKPQKISSFSITNFDQKETKIMSNNRTNVLEIEYKSNILPDINTNRVNIYYIIIVDDNRHIRSSIRNCIEKILAEKKLLSTYYILEGNDGIDILKYVIDAKYSQSIKLIITDENMEFMQGSSAIKIIRDFEKQKKINNYKIFSATSYEDILSENFIKSAGADIIMTKPFSKGKLQAMLEKYEIIKI